MVLGSILGGKLVKNVLKVKSFNFFSALFRFGAPMTDCRVTSALSSKASGVRSAFYAPIKACLEEGLPTEMARERRIPCVHSSVYIELTLACKSLSTVHAGEALVPAVHFEVLQQTLLVDKGSAACVTNKRSLSASNAHYALSSTLAHESLTTVTAHVGRFPGMHAQVHVQANLVGARLAAVLTRERRLPGRVTAHVRIEQALVSEGGPAVFAGEGLVAGVRPHVALKAALPQEGLGAEMAYEGAVS